jgi:predicted nucleic acid-binding protein
LANFDSLIQAELLTICELEDEKEEELYIDYSSQLGSGEAMSIAIAQSREYFLATDDRKARRIFLEGTANPAFLLSTADLIRNWAESNLIPSDRLKTALINIRRRANFTPRRIDPNFQWWVNSCL